MDVRSGGGDRREAAMTARCGALAQLLPKAGFRLDAVRHYHAAFGSTRLPVATEWRMSEKPTAEEIALWQRRLASQANNRAWSLAEQSSRTADEDEDMLQAAHAAMHFWKIVGNERNRARAAQLVAHAYALLKLADPASYYVAKSQPLFLSDPAEPWERAMAHAVAANVAAAKGDGSAHREHYRAAEELAPALADRDRAVLQATLRVIPAPTE